MGGRVVAIEGGFGVTIDSPTLNVGRGQFVFFTATPSEAAVVITCTAPSGGSCALESGPDFRWQFTAPTTGSGPIPVTVSATLNGRVKNTSVTFTLGAPADSVQVLTSKLRAKPGEVRLVKAVAQTANGSTPNVQVAAERLVGLGALVSPPQYPVNQPSGSATTIIQYTAPKALSQPNAELFRATSSSPTSPTVNSTRDLNVDALTLTAPLKICAAASISASASSNLVGATFSWQLNAEGVVSGSNYFRNGAVGGTLVLRLYAGPVLVKQLNIDVTTAGCTLEVVPGYITLQPGQSQQFGTNPPAANLTWLASHGTITSTGLYAAPPAQSTAVLATVNARNSSNQIVGTGFVQLTSNVTLSLTPSAVMLGPGQQQVFTYSLNPAGGGISYEYTGSAFAPLTQVSNQMTINVSPSLDEAVNT